MQVGLIEELIILDLASPRGSFVHGRVPRNNQMTVSRNSLRRGVSYTITLCPAASVNPLLASNLSSLLPCWGIKVTGLSLFYLWRQISEEQASKQEL